MSGNPFDDLGAAVESLRREVRTLATGLVDMRQGFSLAPLAVEVAALRAMLMEPAAEWETMTDACERRRVGRGTLLRFIKDGTLTGRRVVGPGIGGKWLLLVADLDKNFPVVGTRREKKKPGTQRPGFSGPRGSVCQAEGPNGPTLDTVQELFG